MAFRSRTRQKIVNNYNNRKWAQARRAVYASTAACYTTEKPQVNEVAGKVGETK